MGDAKTVCGACNEFVHPSCGGHTINCPACGYTMYSYKEAREDPEAFEGERISNSPPVGPLAGLSRLYTAWRGDDG